MMKWLNIFKRDPVKEIPGFEYIGKVGGHRLYKADDCFIVEKRMVSDEVADYLKEISRKLGVGVSLPSVAELVKMQRYLGDGSAQYWSNVEVATNLYKVVDFWWVSSKLVTTESGSKSYVVVPVYRELVGEISCKK
jgi:hypothetical protein